MQPQDIDQVIEIERKSFKSPWPRSAFLQLLNWENVISIVHKNQEPTCPDTVPDGRQAERVGKTENRVIGYGLAIFEDRTMHIINLAVAPTERRKGIGSNILNELIRYSEKRGATSNHSTVVVLEVRTHNRTAINFYKKFSFKATGIKYRYYPDGDNAIIMERKLNG